jgi:integrase/recombinase XerD
MSARAASPELGMAIESYLEELRVGRRLSANTLDGYRRDLADYASFALRHRLATWRDATTTFVDGFFASLARRGLAGSTVGRRRSALRGFHAFLVRQGRCEQSPLAMLPPTRRDRKLPNALSVEDMEALLAQPLGEEPRALRDRALLELAYASGLRVSELCGLMRHHIDLPSRTLAISGKGGKERVVPFGRAAERALRYRSRAPAARLGFDRITRRAHASRRGVRQRRGGREPNGILEDPAWYARRRARARVHPTRYVTPSRRICCRAEPTSCRPGTAGPRLGGDDRHLHPSRPGLPPGGAPHLPPSPVRANSS